MKLFLVTLFIISNVFAQDDTPTLRVNQSIDFSDDMNFANLDLAIERQLNSYSRTGLKGQIKFGTTLYPKTALKESLLLLQQLSHKAQGCLKIQAPNCMEDFSRELNNLFAIYRPVPKQTEQGYQSNSTTQFTSYYSPDFHGSRTPSERYKHAIYSMPPRPSEQGYTRVEIDFQNMLQGKGHDIFWVEESLFDLYLLHVQGGGRINITNPDGSTEIKYLSYSGTNGKSFQMLWRYMVGQGYLDAKKDGVPAQRKFLEDHPEKQEEIFATCPSYIYFKESTEEPVGLDNIPLTEGRSLAIDRTIYKTMGMINFVKTVKAVGVDESGNIQKAPFSRFFIVQDTGGAIRGNARCDLYFGYGPEAELVAYNMNEMGEQYFLIKK